MLIKLLRSADNGAGRKPVSSLQKVMQVPHLRYLQTSPIFPLSRGRSERLARSEKRCRTREKRSNTSDKSGFLCVTERGINSPIDLSENISSSITKFGAISDICRSRIRKFNVNAFSSNTTSNDASQESNPCRKKARLQEAVTAVLNKQHTGHSAAIAFRQTLYDRLNGKQQRNQ